MACSLATTRLVLRFASRMGHRREIRAASMARPCNGHRRGQLTRSHGAAAASESRITAARRGPARLLKLHWRMLLSSTSLKN